MAELTPQERLQPALLDRLTDDEPGTSQEPREHRVMSKRQLRQAVLRDLAWLFNATRLEVETDLSKVPYARKSVVNFGLPALSGQTASSLDVAPLLRRHASPLEECAPAIARQGCGRFEQPSFRG